MLSASKFVYTAWTVRFYHILRRYRGYARDPAWLACDSHNKLYNNAGFVEWICFNCEGNRSWWQIDIAALPWNGYAVLSQSSTSKCYDISAGCHGKVTWQWLPVKINNESSQQIFAWQLTHGEDWFRKTRKRSNFSMWALAIRCFCEELKGAQHLEGGREVTFIDVTLQQN